MPRYTITNEGDIENALRRAGRAHDLFAAVNAAEPADDDQDAPKRAQPAPLPGGSYDPAPTRPSGEAMLRSAYAAAKGWPVDPLVARYVQGGGSSSASWVVNG